jgi:hypothetical protein
MLRLSKQVLAHLRLSFIMEVSTAYPRIACGTPVDRRGLGESCHAASRTVPWVLLLRTGPGRAGSVPQGVW